MKDLPSSIISSLEALFLQFNFRRLLFWLFIIIAIIVTLTTAENLTGYTYFSRTERKVAILKDLHELSKNEITQNKNLNPIYQDIVAEINSYEIEPLSFMQFFAAFNTIALQTPEEFGKFISGGFLGFLVAISGLIDRKKGAEGWSSAFFGGLVFGLIFAFIGMFIPTLWNPWVNYLGLPIFQVTVILLISKWGQA